MKERFANISKRTWTRIVLVTILFVIVAFGFAGEKVACNNGIGWDGMNYYTSMQHFIPMIKHHGYDQYAIMRVMPWGLTNIVCAIMGIEVNRDVAIASGIIYNTIAIIIAVFFFFRISNLKRWKIATEVLGFSFIFFTYQVLKMVGYYPILSDMFGLTIGIMICYYFLAEKKWALVLCGLAGTFIWPTTPIVAFALAFFPRKALPTEGWSESKINRLALSFGYFMLAALPMLILIQKIFQYQEDRVSSAMQDICPLTTPTSTYMLVIACICSCAYVYFMVSAFKVSLFDTLKESLIGKPQWINYGLFLLFLMITILCKSLLANEDAGALTTIRTLKVIAITSMTDPFVFVENHFIYYGMGFLLILLLWKDVAKIIMQQGLGYLFVVAIWVLFSLRPEARVSIMYYVFPLIALLMVLDQQKLRPAIVYVGVICSLLVSRFWLPINVQGMESYFEWDNYSKFIEFPAQRYFMSQGHWQSHEMYAVFMAITVVNLVILYKGKRNQWFVQKSDE